MFERLNDWKIIAKYPTKSDKRKSKKIKCSILCSHHSHMSCLIKFGDTVAQNIDNKNVGSIYIFK